MFGTVLDHPDPPPPSRSKEHDELEKAYNERLAQAMTQSKLSVFGSDPRIEATRQPSTPKSVVYKDVDGKPPLSLLPWAGLAKVAWVRAYGDAKYEPDSWRKVPGAKTVYVDAALRHIGAHADGERTDPESGLSHLAHAACNLLFLLALDADVESD